MREVVSRVESDKTERVREKESGGGLKRGRGPRAKPGVLRKCKCQVNSSSEQPFSTRGGSRPL